MQGCDLLVPSAARIADAAATIAGERGLPITLVDTGRCRGDAVFADAVSAQLGRRPHHRLPADADLGDIAAALSSPALFLGSSLHGAITALAHDRPFVLMNFGDESKLRGFVESAGLERRLVEDVAVDAIAGAGSALADGSTAPLVARLQADVDAHFDRLASAIEEARRRRRAAAVARAGRPR